ncbi:hypothetical protein HMPREF0658_0027 [Hoylesella marshii DSM 16973 = JCM 13450]|uniref:Uncharacterized protein n=1 Tax=Hoylesella marshii DSM 16973 = JCM 13450 TaxID=862515 RepID=E0NPC6_9BACT|nr:hypothetical protein HMPREF0658_0027 [Hoylesella marshii DSM 16973 = JCM 13450]
MFYCFLYIKEKSISPDFSEEMLFFFAVTLRLFGRDTNGFMV